MFLIFASHILFYWFFFKKKGGDDIQQLVELLQDPEEFADLLKLVGMDKKPLHVRRLKKALRESIIGFNSQDENRLKTMKPLTLADPMNKISSELFSTAMFPGHSLNPQQMQMNRILSPSPSFPPWPLLPDINLLRNIPPSSLAQILAATSAISPTLSSSASDPLGFDVPSQNALLINALTTPVVPATSSPTGNRLTTFTTQSMAIPLVTSASSQTLSGRSSCDTEQSFNSEPLNDPLAQSESNGLPEDSRQSGIVPHRDGNLGSYVKAELERIASPTSFANEQQQLFQLTTTNNPGMPLRPSASLLKGDVQKLSAAVNAIIPHLPSFPLRLINSRNNSERELQEILKLPLNDQSRLDGLRRHSTIFGRFDAPKRLTRPLRHFEVCVNEITHRLVRQIPELVTQREHLFHIARQVVNITNYGMTLTESGEILNRLKAEMQDLVDSEEAMRTKLRTYNKETATTSQAQLRKEIERVVNKLHNRLSQATKHVVLYHSLEED
ncbi:NGFI-A-binding protein [Fasciola gigantica]|uniref:NGFI-A-binding protein n=1 Tax=Fasciola gigantica TaxID=46835 RepID=A0A504Z4N6_FASGI|nr:NGFI-A-binding protein [Fasciola gigantica]